MHHWSRCRQIQRNYFDLFNVDVLPNVKFGPITDGENPDALSGRNLSVIDVPEFGSLILRVPSMVSVSEAKNSLLSP